MASEIFYKEVIYLFVYSRKRFAYNRCLSNCLYCCSMRQELDVLSGEMYMMVRLSSTETASHLMSDGSVVPETADTGRLFHTSSCSVLEYRVELITQ